MTRDLEYVMCLLVFRTLNSGSRLSEHFSFDKGLDRVLTLSVVLSYVSLPFIPSCVGPLACQSSFGL